MLGDLKLLEELPQKLLEHCVDVKHYYLCYQCHHLRCSSEDEPCGFFLDHDM